jgi:hypothetical protein
MNLCARALSDTTTAAAAAFGETTARKSALLEIAHKKLLLGNNCLY